MDKLRKVLTPVLLIGIGFVAGSWFEIAKIPSQSESQPQQNVQPPAEQYKSPMPKHPAETLKAYYI